MAGKEPSVRKILERSDIGEPAEFQRVVLGIARTPTPDQRWIAVNGVKEPLPLHPYNCDGCNAEIKPGEECGAWSVWTEDMKEVPRWEDQYIEVPA
jgi:hypothetical protein